MYQVDGGGDCACRLTKGVVFADMLPLGVDHGGVLD